MGFGKDKRGVIRRRKAETVLSTLADKTALQIAQISCEQDYRLLKAEIFASMIGLTSGEGTGLRLGIADAELSVTEIKECLEANGPVDRNDRDLQEKAERWVHLIGTFHGNPTTGSEGNFCAEMGGPLIVFKGKPWTFQNAEGFQIFVYNDTGSALTTGSSIRLNMTHYGVWVS